MPQDASACRFAPRGGELFLNPTYLASLPGSAAYQVRVPKEPRSEASAAGISRWDVCWPTGVEHEWTRRGGGRSASLFRRAHRAYRRGPQSDERREEGRLCRGQERGLRRQDLEGGNPAQEAGPERA